jgi:site-specific recombinase XerD
VTDSDEVVDEVARLLDEHGADLEPMTPEEGVARFLDSRSSSVRESTWQNDKTRLEHFLEWCDESDVDDLNDLTGRRLGDFVAWRRDQIAPITLQKQLSSVRMALRWWADQEAVPEGIAEKLHSPELPDGAESRDSFLDADRAEQALDYYESFQYASRDHALLGLLWRTGMRRGAVHSLDVDDLVAEDHAVRLEHRPETGTKLKNGDAGERFVYLGPRWYRILEAYRDHPKRPSGLDDHGRRALFAKSGGGRPSPQTLSKWVIRALHPCSYTGECPHDVGEDDCDARGRDANLSACPSKVTPHDVRRGAITHHLNQNVQPETVSERMDVSLEVLYRHYDARTEREKMAVRREQLPDN